MDYGKEIAKAALDIGAITLSPDKPYKWASGFFMPIYNDNRKHLSYPENRKLITDGFKHLVETSRIDVDLISGTTTAGIAPAASLAQALRLPMRFFDGPESDLGQLVFTYTPEFIDSLVDRIPKTECDVIVSTCPAAIIPAVWAANQRGLPFAYVRESAKKHGLRQQVEGVLKPGQRAVVADFYNQHSYLEPADGLTKEQLDRLGEGAFAALHKAGVTVVDFATADIFEDGRRESNRYNGKHQLQIEDLVSFAGSCVDEVKGYRKAGAEIRNCMSIFSYGFDSSMKRFSDADVEFGALLEYPKLLETAVEEKAIEEKDVEMLAEWRADPEGWGAKHGFPPVAKA